MAKYDVGDTVICSITVKSGDTLTDPATSMKIGITKPEPISEEIVASTAMVKDSTGKYHYDFASEGKAAGKYRVKYIATDGSRITIEKEVFVLE